MLQWEADMTPQWKDSLRGRPKGFETRFDMNHTDDAARQVREALKKHVWTLDPTVGFVMDDVAAVLPVEVRSLSCSVLWLLNKP